MRNIHFKTCTCLLGILLMLFSGIQARGASLEVQQERKISGTVIDEKGEPVIGASEVISFRFIVPSPISTVNFR